MKHFRKWIIRLLPVIIIIMIAGLILSRMYTPESSVRTVEFRVNAFDAAEHAGEYGEVCGVVESADFIPSIGGEPTFLNLGRAHPDQPFTAVIWGEDRNNFRVPPEQSYLSRHICVTGRIRMHNDVAQIRVRNPEQIKEKQ